MKTNNTSNRPRTAGALARTILLAGLAAGGNAATAQVLMIPREQKTSNNSLLNFCLIRYNAGSKTTAWRSTGGWMLLRIDYPQTVGEVKVRVEKLVVKGPAGWSFDAETGESPEATAAVFHGTKSADGWQEFAIGSDAYSARKYLRLTFDGAAELNGLEIWGSAVAAARFNHPGIFTTTSEADRVRATVGAGEEPFRSAWTDEGLQRCKGFTLTPNLGVADYVRCNDPDVYCSQFAVFGKQLSFLAAYWQVRGGDQLPANMTAALKAWTEKAPLLEGTETPLRGIHGITYAAELMRARYPGWNDAVEGTLKKWMRETALLLAQVHDLSSHLAAHPLQIDTTKAFAELIGGHNHNGNNLQALMELAIFLDDWHDFNRAVHLYRLLNYANIDRATGESGEMCRDYAHGHGNIAHMGFIAELAWHQGVDLYSMRGNALLTMSEYHAAQLLGELRGVTCTQGEYDGMSSSFTPEEKALFDDYAGPYEVLYNHYVNRMGLSMPYTQRYLAQERPMGGTDTQNAFGATLFYPGSSRQALPDPVAVDGTAVPSRDHVTAAAAPGRSGRSAAVRYDLRGKTLGAAGTDVVGCTVETAPYGGRLLVRVDPR